MDNSAIYNSINCLYHSLFQNQLVVKSQQCTVQYYMDQKQNIYVLYTSNRYTAQILFL